MVNIYQVLENVFFQKKDIEFTDEILNRLKITDIEKKKLK